MLKIIQHIEIKAEYVMSPEVNASQAWLDHWWGVADLKSQSGKEKRFWGWVHKNLQVEKSLKGPSNGSLMLILENAFLSCLEDPGHNQREQIQMASNIHFQSSLSSLAESQLSRSELAQWKDGLMLDAQPSQLGHFPHQKAPMAEP